MLLPATPAHIPALGFLKQIKPWAHLGMDGAAVTSRNQWFLVKRLRSSGLQQGGSKGQGARPGAITAWPNHPVPSLVPQPLAKQTQLAQPESCSRASKTQQTHP